MVDKLIKGTFVVADDGSGKRGVISEPPKNGAAYIKWLTSWSPATRRVEYYMEYMNLAKVKLIPCVSDQGLLELQSRVMRGI